MAAFEQATMYEVLRHHGVSKGDAAKMAAVVTAQMDLSNWVKAPWGDLINMTEEPVVYVMDMSGFPPGTMVFMTDLTDTLAFMFEVWVLSPSGEDLKVVHVGLERNVAARMPERGEAMRERVKEQLEVVAWEAHADLCA